VGWLSVLGEEDAELVCTGRERRGVLGGRRRDRLAQLVCTVLHWVLVREWMLEQMMLLLALKCGGEEGVGL